jgi:RNA polymerase sigma factor (sigma-70 family)
MQHISKHRIVPGFNERAEDCIKWIYDFYQGPIYAFIKKLTRNSSETPDLVAKTFLVLLEHELPFENLRKLEFFLYRTARNLSRVRLRDLEKFERHSDRVADYYDAIDEADERAAEQSAAFHQLIQLGSEILSSRCKEVFLLCYIDQMKNAAIAKKLAIHEKTVANLKLRAYDKLKKEIQASKPAAFMDLLGILLL